MAAPVQALGAILAVTYLAYFLVYAPAIYSADWALIIGGAATGTWIDFNRPWPFILTPFVIQDRIFGLNILAFYLILGALHAAQAFLLYAIATQFEIPRRHVFGLAIALLFLVYPTNYTHMWLTMVKVYTAAVVTLLYAASLTQFARTGRPIPLAAALVALAISLGIYETQLGLVCAWPLILFFVPIGAGIGRRLALLTPIGLAVSFVLWRAGHPSAAPGDKDQFLNDISMAPSELLSRLVEGYKVTLGHGWTTTVAHFLPSLSSSNWYSVLLLVGALLAIWLASRWASARRGAEPRLGLSPDRLGDIWPYAIAGFVGLILVVAGYLPTAFKYAPHLGGQLSRINFFASIGGAVFTASMLMLGTLLIAGKRCVAGTFLTAAFPFLALGIAAQVLVQGNAAVAWQEQRSIYRALFSQAPNFKDGTTVVFVLPGYGVRMSHVHWRRPPINGFWSVERAIQLFYDNPTLSGDVLYPDLDNSAEPIATPDGLVNPAKESVHPLKGAVTPYDRSVFFIYDGETGVLHPLSELPAVLVEGAAHPIPLFTDRILPGPVPDAHLRRLVTE